MAGGAVSPPGGAAAQAPIQRAQEEGGGQSGPENEPDEHVSDSEFEGPKMLKKLMAGRSPTREIREQHEIENHAVYRDWCDVCVDARGVGTPHRRREKKKQAEEEQGGARVYVRIRMSIS